MEEKINKIKINILFCSIPLRAPRLELFDASAQPLFIGQPLDEGLVFLVRVKPRKHLDLQPHHIQGEKQKMYNEKKMYNDKQNV